MGRIIVGAALVLLAVGFIVGAFYLVVVVIRKIRNFVADARDRTLHAMHQGKAVASTYATVARESGAKSTDALTPAIRELSASAASARSAVSRRAAASGRALGQTGRLLILLTACLAVPAMFLDWVVFAMFIQRSGIELGLSATLLAWVYPVLRALGTERIRFLYGLLCGLVPVGISVGAASKAASSIWLASDVGLWLFVMTCSLYFLGLMLYVACFDFLRAPELAAFEPET